MKDKKKPEDLESDPEAWERFERAVDKVAKAPPQHRTKSGALKRKASSRDAD